MEPGGEDAPAFVTVAEQDLLETYHFTVRRVTLEHGDVTFDRDIEVHPGSVAVVALTDGGRVALVRQYRVPLGRWTLEIPAGRPDAGEDAVRCGTRELREETGLVPGSVRVLTRFANSPGHSTQWTTVLLATGCTPGDHGRVGPEEEAMTGVTLPLDEALGLVDQGVVCDAKSIIGLTRAARAVRDGRGGR